MQLILLMQETCCCCCCCCCCCAACSSSLHLCASQDQVVQHLPHILLQQNPDCQSWQPRSSDRRSLLSWSVEGSACWH